MPPISFSLVRKKRIKGRYSPPFSFSRKKKRSAVNGVRRKRGFGAGPRDPCFYRSAAAHNNFSAGLVQDGHRAVFPTAAAGAGRGSGCVAMFGNGSAVLPILHPPSFSFSHALAHGFPFSREKKENGGRDSGLFVKQNKFCKISHWGTANFLSAPGMGPDEVARSLP